MIKFIEFKMVSYEESKEYGKNQGNRAFNHPHLEKIKRQCEASNMEIIPPITVNVITNNIIDGQHRHKAYQDLIDSGTLSPDTPLKVMMVEIPVEKEMQAIIEANTNSKNWTLDDYIVSYSKAGVNSYVKLDNWCKRHSLTCEKGKSKFRYGAAIIKGKRCATDLKVGDFELTDEELSAAEETHAELAEIVQLLKLRGKGAWIEALAVSWAAAKKQHDFKTWFKELRSKKQRFMKAPKDNSKDWDTIFAQAHYAIDAKKGL